MYLLLSSQFTWNMFQLGCIWWGIWWGKSSIMSLPLLYSVRTVYVQCTYSVCTVYVRDIRDARDKRDVTYVTHATWQKVGKWGIPEKSIKNVAQRWWPRTVAHSSQKLWPVTDFLNFALCKSFVYVLCNLIFWDKNKNSFILKSQCLEKCCLFWIFYTGS